MAIEAARLMVSVGADTSDATRDINSFRSGLNQTAADLGRSGAYLTAGITTPLVGAGVAALKFSTDFNAAMADVASLGLAPERVLELKGNLQGMAVDVGKSTDDLAGGLYQVVSAFGDTNDTVEILNINARAAAAGLATTTDAINLTSAVTKGYGDTSAEALQHVADLAFQTVALGQTTFPELASSMGKVVLLAAELGLAQEELFAVMATGTGVTGNASEVVTQLRSSLQSIMQPTASMTGLIESMGFASGKAMIEQLGYHGSILAITDAAEASGKPLGDFMGRVEGQILALALAGPQADVYTEKLAAMGDVTGAVDAAFRAQTEGINATGFAMRNAGIRAEILMQKLGDGIAPAIDRVLALAEPLVGWVEGLVDTFTKADEGTQLMVVGLAAFAASIGPVMLGLAGVAAALAFLLTPIGAVVAAVGLLGSAFITDFGGIRTVTMEAVDAISALATDAGGWLSGLVTRAQGIHERWAGYITPIVEGYEQIASIAQAALQGNLEPARQAISSAFESIRSFDIGEFIGGLATAGTNLASAILDSFRAIDLTALRTDIISKLGLDNFKLFPEGTGIDIGSLPADLARVGSSLSGLAASAAEFVGIDLSTITFDVKGLQTAIIQQLNLVDFAVIAIGLRLKVTKALQDLTWEDVKVGAGDLQSAIIRQLADVDFGIIATGLRLKATKALQDIDWTALTPDFNQVRIEVGSALSNLTWDGVTAGFQMRLGALFRGIDWSAFDFIDTAGLTDWLTLKAGEVRTAFNSWMGEDNALSRTIELFNVTYDSIAEKMAAVQDGSAFDKLSAAASSLVEVIDFVNISSNDWTAAAVSNFSRFTATILNSASELINDLDADAVGEAITVWVRGWTEQFDAIFADPEGLFDVGQAAGNLASTLTGKLSELFSSDSFGESIGAAVGTSVVAFAQGAAALVKGLAGELDTADFAEFQASSKTFVEEFAKGLISAIPEMDFGALASTLSQALIDAVVEHVKQMSPLSLLGAPGMAAEAGLESAGADMSSFSLGALHDKMMAAGDTFVATIDAFFLPIVDEPVWSEHIDSLVWPEETGTFKWLDWIEKLIWPPTIADFAWTTWLNELTWSDFIDGNLMWATFIPSNLAWKDFIPVNLMWNRFIPLNLYWSNFIPNVLSWSTYVTSIDWGTFIPFQLRFPTAGEILTAIVTNMVGRMPLPPMVPIPGNANGRSHFQGGWGWVGEQGPELVRLPRGSTIYPNEQSMAMAGAGDGGIHYHHHGDVHIHTAEDKEAFAQDIMRRIKNHRRG